MAQPPKHLLETLRQFRHPGGSPNVNVLLLALALRVSPRRVETMWRHARRAVKIEGEKGNYLLAWNFVFKMAGLETAPLYLGDLVNVGRISGEVAEYDEECVRLRAPLGSPVVEPFSIPIAQVYLLRWAIIHRP